MTTLFAFLAAYIATSLLTKMFVRYADGLGLVDHPNERSSHDAPKPRGGGIVFVCVIILCAVWLAYLPNMTSVLTEKQFWVVIFGGSVIAIIGYLDDCKGLPQALRLLVHLFTFSVVLSYIGLPANDLSAPAWLLFTIFVLSASWLLNLYNFMDGIDGLAAIEGVFVFFSVALLLYLQGYEGTILPVLLCSGGALLGFLRYNWPPAKLFMGDVGSGFLGYVMAVLILVTWLEDVVRPVVWFILLGFFIVDATLTLLGRILKGEAFYRAHKKHVYQLLAVNLGSHKSATSTVMVINVVWLLPLAFISAFRSEYEYFALVTAYIPLLTLYLVINRQFSMKR